MKKFLAIGIVSLGGLGMIGMGASVASAAPIVPTAASVVCTSASASASQAALSVPLFAANNAANTAASAIDPANTAATTSETAYVTDAMAVIHDVDNSALPGQITDDTATLNTAVTTFVNAIVAQSAANLAVFNTTKALNNLELSSSLYAGLISAACG